MEKTWTYRYHCEECESTMTINATKDIFNWYFNYRRDSTGLAKPIVVRCLVCGSTMHR